jgi:hypothetical protein
VKDKYGTFQKVAQRLCHWLHLSWIVFAILKEVSFELIFTDNTQGVAVTCLGVFNLLETNLTNPVQRVRYPLMPSLTMLDKIYGSL